MRRHMNWTFGRHCPAWGTNSTLISTKKCTRHIQSSLNIHRKQKEWQKTADTPSRTTLMLYDYTRRAFTEANTWGRWGMQPHKLPSTFPAMLPGRPLLVISSASPFTNTETKGSVPRTWNSQPAKPQYLLPACCPETNPISLLTKELISKPLCLKYQQPIQHLFSTSSHHFPKDAESWHPSLGLYQLLNLAYIVLQGTGTLQDRQFMQIYRLLFSPTGSGYRPGCLFSIHTPPQYTA